MASSDRQVASHGHQTVFQTRGLVSSQKGRGKRNLPGGCTQNTLKSLRGSIVVVENRYWWWCVRLHWQPPPPELAKAAIQQQEAKNGSREGEKCTSIRR